MDDWGTSEQYFVDTDSRYPVFSDINTTDYLMEKAPRNYSRAIVPVAEETGIYKKLFQQEITGKPAQGPCQCKDCVLARADIHKQKQTVAPSLCKPAIAPTGQMEIKIDTTVLLFMFMFVVIIFICCCYAKAIHELKAQIKILQHMMKQ